MMKPALLIVDMQNGCRNDTKAKDDFETAVSYINAVSQIFREKGFPVVIVQDAGVGEGTNFEVVKEINVSANDLYIKKEFGNSFWKTNLDTLLKDLGVDFLVISGFAAMYCILATYNGALERGYKCTLLQNGIAGYEIDEAAMVSKSRPIVSYTAIRYFLV
ncbi:MAG: cysteine hydrolase [Petrotogaceae bacterium]|nr:cysteine hydrolase [Petrotogaceae bacterium]